jgi:FtsZ-binding cell division protein ZapB/DNA-binding cell septation regulator SpoVG
LRIVDCRFEIGSSRLRRGIAQFAILNLQFAIGICAQAQGNSSLSESKNESAVHPATAEALLQENEQLQKRLSIAQESLKALTSSLAESNADAEELRRKYSDLELRMEALGLASANKDRAKLEQRLLAAVSDLQLAQKERDDYRDQMLRLNEAVLCYLKTSQAGDAKARMDLEAQLRSINTLITKSTGAPGQPEPGLVDGSVISVKEEWSFVVGNLGGKQGVKIGMPMRVMRDDRRIATLRVVDVRQKICGAVIQEMNSNKEKIRVGDRLQVDAQPNVSLK